MIALAVITGFVIGNFIYAWMFSRPFMQAIEYSFYQAAAVGIYALALNFAQVS